MSKRNKVRVTPKSVGTPKAPTKSTQVVDDLKDVGSGLMSDVIIPAFKNMLYDFITSGSSQMIFHDDRGVRRNAQRNHKDYSSIYDGQKRTKAALSSSSRARTRRNMVRDIVLNTRQDARDIIDELSENIEHYGFTTVADYYECCSYSGSPQDNNYGWDKSAFRGVRIISSSDGGYIIDLPRPIPFD